MNEETNQLWITHWNSKASLEDSASYLGRFLRKKRLEILENILISLPKYYSVLDVGCGKGDTLQLLKVLGFRPYGIDISETAINECRNKNLQAQVEDAYEMSFSDKSFDIVFSEGLWEHFRDPRKHISEFARVSKHYIIVIQPNHYSFFGRILKILWDTFQKNKGGVPEYSFTLGYFRTLLKHYGFESNLEKHTILNEQSIMVFRRNSSWKKSQELERLYSETKESQIWKIPHSEQYWKDFLGLEAIPYPTLEVGCGKHGLYNFNPNIIGIDSLKLPNRNYVRATAEYLPFQHSPLIICCNSLDHFHNPKLAMKEMRETSDKILLWVYVYPRVSAFIIKIIDKIHPFHFTKSQLHKLGVLFRKKEYSPLRFLKYTNSLTQKFKLVVMYMLGIKGVKFEV